MLKSDAQEPWLEIKPVIGEANDLAGEDDGPKPGIVAGLIAFAAVQIGKLLAVLLIIGSATDVKVKVSAQQMITLMADDIVRQRTAQNKPLRWPPGMNAEKATEAKDYPADVWQEASKAWDKLGPEEQRTRIRNHEAEIKALIGELKSGLTWRAFKESYGPFDILWFFLAVGTAFKIGSGLRTE